MTADLNITPQAHPDVIVELRSLRTTCGSPTYQQICDISERLGGLYGHDHKFQPLSITTVSEILTGRRKPKWERVRAFVLSCNRYAFESNGMEIDPGLDALPYWFGRLNAAADPSVEPEAGSVAGKPVPEAEPAPTPPHPHEELVLRVLAGRGLVEPAPYGLQPDEPIELDALLKQLRIHTTDPLALTAGRYWDLFQHPHVVELLHAAHDRGDPEAAGRLAVLLICAGLSEEAHPWLERAAADGEPLATAMLHAQPAYRRGLAVEFAFELAVLDGSQPWEVTPDPQTPAELYGRVAARCGLPGAAYWLAARHAGRRDVAGAAYWFTHAAEQGHHDATGRFEEIHHDIWAKIDPNAITVEDLSDEWATEPPPSAPDDYAP
ncbi:hypothetical protein ACRYCC_31185 [Actinomadura scrupuli]|uniref:hypothetical protein n=1 Tax=Actinomadura scrupuli TaxID=559629 RepID=UPI003D98FB1E